MSRRKQNKPQHIANNSQNVDLALVSLDNSVPGDIFRLKVTNDDPVTTGIFTAIPLPRGSRFGPFKCSLKYSEPETEIDDGDASDLIADDLDILTVKIQSEAGIWLSLLKTTGDIKHSNLHIYLHDDYLWCDVPVDLDPDIQLVAMLLLQSRDLRGPNMPHTLYNNNKMPRTMYNNGIARVLRRPRYSTCFSSSLDNGVDFLHMPATYRLVPEWHTDHTCHHDNPPVETTGSNQNGKRLLEEADEIASYKLLKCDITSPSNVCFPGNQSPGNSPSPQSSPRREHSPPITGAFKCSSCPFTADKKSWLIEHVLQQHMEADDSEQHPKSNNPPGSDEIQDKPLTMDTLKQQRDFINKDKQSQCSDQSKCNKHNKSDFEVLTGDKELVLSPNILVLSPREDTQVEDSRQSLVSDQSDLSDDLTYVSDNSCNVRPPVLNNSSKSNSPTHDRFVSPRCSPVRDGSYEEPVCSPISPSISPHSPNSPSELVNIDFLSPKTSYTFKTKSPGARSLPPRDDSKSPKPGHATKILKQFTTDESVSEKSAKIPSDRTSPNQVNDRSSPSLVKPNLHLRMTSSGNVSPSCKRSPSTSDSPESEPATVEWMCDECDISFSSERTYTAHKKFYCQLRAKRPKLNSAYTLMPAMMTPALLSTPMISPAAMVTPFGMTYAVPYLVPVGMPPMVSPESTDTRKKEVHVAKNKKVNKPEEQPLDLSCRKPKPKAILDCSKMRAVIPGLDTTAAIRKALPSVSRCEECNIVFYKHENYMVHKQHYCAGRRGKATSVKVEKPTTTPPLQVTTPPVSPTTSRNNNLSTVPDLSSPGSSKPGSPCSSSDEYTVQYFCLPCKIQFSSPDTLEAHQQYYCPARSLMGAHDNNTECPHCDARFISLDELAKHLSTHATMKIPMYCCPYCQYVAQSDSRLLDHIKSHAPTKAYRCTLCGYRGNTVRGMRMHGKSHLDAGEKFTDDNMIEYEEPPLIPKRLRTVTENVAITTEPIHISHERKRSRSKSVGSADECRQAPHICVECSAMFTDTNKLRAHMQCHLQEKYFNCNMCEFVTDSKADLVRHVNVFHKFSPTSSDVKKEVKNSEKYTIENLINSGVNDAPEDPKPFSTVTPGDRSPRQSPTEGSNTPDGVIDSNKKITVKKEPGEISPTIKPISPLYIGTAQNLSPPISKVGSIHSPVKSNTPPLENNLSPPPKMVTVPKLSSLSPSSPVEMDQPINYCSQCDIKFVYLSTFLAHKKYYCSSHAGERKQTIQV